MCVITATNNCIIRRGASLLRHSLYLGVICGIRRLRNEKLKHSMMRKNQKEDLPKYQSLPVFFLEENFRHKNLHLQLLVVSNNWGAVQGNRLFRLESLSVLNFRNRRYRIFATVRKSTLLRTGLFSIKFSYFSVR